MWESIDVLPSDGQIPSGSSTQAQGADLPGLLGDWYADKEPEAPEAINSMDVSNKEIIIYRNPTEKQYRQSEYEVTPYDESSFDETAGGEIALGLGGHDDAWGEFVTERLSQADTYSHLLNSSRYCSCHLSR